MDRPATKRRALLAHIGTVTTFIAVAGCLEGMRVGAEENREHTDPGNDGEGGPGGGDDSDAGFELGEISIERLESECATGDPGPVSIRLTDEKVTIEGALETSTPCYYPVLERTEYDSDDGVLEVSIGAESEEGVCIQCIGEIVYEARLEFETGTPDSVSIVHETMDERREIARVECEHSGE